MTPLRVMHVVLSLSPGGTERLVIEMCRASAPAVHSTVCCLDTAGAWAPELTGAGVGVHALERRRGFRPLLARRIAALATEHRVDVIHCHHYSPYVYGALASLVCRSVAIVYTEHGRLSNAGPSTKRRLINPLLARIRGSLYAVSEDLKRHMVAEGFPGDCIGVIYNGIAVGPAIGPDHRRMVRNELGIAPETFVVGSIGRLDPVKNLPLLVRAHVAATRHLPGSLLVIVGEGSDRGAIEATVGALGAGNAVQLIGYTAQARRLLAAFDVYVNSSAYEGVSLTILEAMAANLPVVATRTGGNPEVVVNEETGVLVPTGDPVAMAAVIAGLAGDSSRRRAMGCAGRQRVVSHFSLERMVGMYHAVYERVAQRS